MTARVLTIVVPAFLIGLCVSVSLAIIITLLVEIFTGLRGIGVLMVLV